ncbi:M20 family metallo-hydrolase [Shouchella hunanensis]|uniref:M20 family metallo-hydrolase n=1 Tax=Shouchella hunanensis TaxID=766894 RepID=A0ABY7WAM4_9BACI|nr:M20 family metallo-hydrolase [Shouchella hunanensis]WDF05748.1 M20 family metallo-hydrolase [Shouchella hunanensis]
MNVKTVTINGKRLSNSIHELSQFGQNDGGGLDRTTFTDSELKARDWLKEQLSKLNVHVHTDEAANIWGKRVGQKKRSIVCGSHIDTVPNGGKFDGALGVLIGLEILRTLEENEIETEHDVELVSFSAEEPNPFGLSTFGSRAMAGKLTAEQIKGVRNADGMRLIDALERAGGNAAQFDHCVRRENDLLAYLEVHIEQGKRLIDAQVPLGIVTGITGIYREELTIKGVPNHAGTTVMTDRTDALVAAAELILAVKNVCTDFPKAELVGTVGQIHVLPNATNIIPGEVVLAVEIRGEKTEDLQKVQQELQEKKAYVETTYGVQIETKVRLNQAPVAMSENVMTVMERQAEIGGFPTMRLGSMAGHDAAHMASLTSAGMIFVPSVAGKSHCPEEESKMEDIEKAANVCLRTLLEIDREGGSM